MNINGQANRLWDEIERRAKGCRADIVCLSETHWKMGQRGKQMNGYTQYWRRRDAEDRKGGGLAVFVKKDIRATEWKRAVAEEGGGKEVLWVQLQSRREKLAVGVRYMGLDKYRESNDQIEQELTRDIATLKQEGQAVVLLGDGNGHIAENDGGVKGVERSTDLNGRRLLRLMDKMNLEMVNRTDKCKGKWTWMRQQQKSVIDYVFVEEEKVSMVRKMLVDDEGMGLADSTDHNWIEIDIEVGAGTRKVTQVNRRPRWNIGVKTDWNAYRKLLEEKLDEWNEQLDSAGEDALADVAYAQLVRILTQTGEETIGRTCGPRKVKANRRIRKAIKKRNSAGRRWRAANRTSQPSTDRLWSRYMEQKKGVIRLKKLRDRKKNQKWLTALLAGGKWKGTGLWQQIGKGRTKDGLEAIQEGERLITNEEDIKAKVKQFFDDLGKEDASSGAVLVVRPLNIREIDEAFEELISDYEVARAIKSAKVGKAVGLDEIPNEFLKEGGDQLAETLTRVFNMMHSEEWLPREWSEDRVILLHKKNARTNLDNYRGLSMTSNISKVFARVLGERLTTVVEDRNMLGEMQGGFRKGRNTIDNVFILTTMIERAQRQRRSLYLAFVDLRKAYDSVWREGLWAVLQEKGLGGKFLTLLQGLYAGHRRRFQVGESLTDWSECNRGVRQGCVLSPTLFALYLADLSSRLQTIEGVRVGNVNIAALLFADDMVLAAETKDALMRELVVLRDFVKERHLEISFPKTEIMKLGPGTAQVCEWSLVDEEGNTLGIIKEGNYCDYLGVRLGRNRIFQQQHRKIERALPRKIGTVMARAEGTPIRKRAADEIWRVAAKPALLYGTEVVPAPKTWVRLLERAQNRMGRWLLGVRRGTAAEGVITEVGWGLMEDEIRKRKVNYWEYLKNLPPERWAKQALKEILEGEFTSEWYRGVVEARRAITMYVLDGASKRQRELGWFERREAEWQRAKPELSSLEAYPKETVAGAAGYVWEESRRSKIMGKMRLGDVGAKWGPEKGRCAACEARQVADMRMHILLDCQYLEGRRGQAGLSEVIKAEQVIGRSRVEIVKIILEDTSVKNMSVVKEMYLAWKAGGN